MKKVALIGSCGSIGLQVLEIVRRHPEEFEIVGLATRSENLIFESQIAEFRPKLAAAFVTGRGYSFQRSQRFRRAGIFAYGGKGG